MDVLVLGILGDNFGPPTISLALNTPFNCCCVPVEHGMGTGNNVRLKLNSVFKYFSFYYTKTLYNSNGTSYQTRVISANKLFKRSGTT